MKGGEQKNICGTTEQGLTHPAQDEGKLLRRGWAVPIPKGWIRPKNELTGKVREAEGRSGRKEQDVEDTEQGPSLPQSTATQREVVEMRSVGVGGRPWMHLTTALRI